MRIVHLVRHGTHEEVGRVLSGRSDIALNEPGRAEAEAVARWFAATPPRSLHSSPRARALETAVPLAAMSGLAVVTAPALDEIDFGAFTGRAFAALDGDPDWDRWNRERERARCPGGETMGEAVQRALDYLSAIAATDAPAVCVTHCDIVRGVVTDRLGLPPGRLLTLGCDPGSITTLAFDGGEARLLALNVRARPPA